MIFEQVLTSGLKEILNLLGFIPPYELCPYLFIYRNVTSSSAEVGSGRTSMAISQPFHEASFRAGAVKYSRMATAESKSFLVAPILIATATVSQVASSV
jgi:hypothetical protein